MKNSGEKKDATKKDATRHRLKQRYSQFLDADTTFYLSLLNKLRSLPNRGILEQQTLLYLGDIARYRSRECMPNGPSAQCKASQEFYIAAARAYVDSGNPHNQLAVLATYVDRDLDAVYHYCRALTTRIPFEVARDNVRRLELKIQERAQTSHAKVAEILKEKLPIQKS